MSDAEFATDVEPRPSRWLRRPKLLISAIVVLAVVVWPFAYREVQVLGLPDSPEPFDLEAFGTIEVAAGENSFDDYRLAATHYVDLETLEGAADIEKMVDEQFAAIEQGWTAASPLIREWVDRNRTALEHFQRASARPEFLEYQPRELSPTNANSLGRAPGYLSVLAVLEGSRHHAAGRLDEAWMWYLAAERSPRQRERHQGFVWGGSRQDATFIERWARHPSQDALLLRRALRDLDESSRLNMPQSHHCQCFYFTVRNAFEEVNLWKSGSFAVDPFEDRKLRLQAFLQNEPELSHRLLKIVVANWLEHIDKPLWERPPRAGTTLPMFDPAPMPEHLLQYFVQKSKYHIDNVAEGLVDVDIRYRRGLAWSLLLRANLAVRIRFLETGQFPERLEEVIAPDLLGELPRDPFSPTGETIRYRVDDDGHVTLWSLGPNERDDDGNSNHESGGGGWEHDMVVTSRPTEDP